jgi:O-antigen/teichoic acid export membrane protein
MVVGRVAFPTFAVIQDEDERLRRGLKKAVTYVALVVLPLVCGMAIVAPELTRVLLGEKWIPSILPMQILCGFAIAFSISALSGPLLRSKGRTDIEFRVDLVRFAVLIPCLLVAVGHGTVGVAVCVSVVGFVVALVRQMAANRLVGLSLRDYLGSIAPPASATAVMAVAVVAFRQAATTAFAMPDAALLASMVVLGAIVYVVALKLTRTRALDELAELSIDMVKPLWRKGTGGVPGGE